MDTPPQDPRGELVRPFALTRGRTKPVADIAIEAILVTTARGRQEAPYAGRHKQTIADLCAAQPQSLAEIAAHLGFPLGVAKVLVADMTSESMLTLHNPAGEQTHDERMHMLERVLDGLRKL